MRSGSSMLVTSALMSGESPVASDSARSTSSCRWRTRASTAMVRSAGSLSGLSSACMTPRSICRNSARARATPSTSTRMPDGPLAICRMMHTVPTLWRSSGPGSSVSFVCSSVRTMRSPASARFTASTDIGRFTPSGETLSGSTTAPRSGTTGSSEGNGGTRGSAIGSQCTSDFKLSRLPRQYTHGIIRVLTLRR